MSTNFNGSEFVTITATGPRPLDVVVDPKSKVVIWYVAAVLRCFLVDFVIDFFFVS